MEALCEPGLYEELAAKTQYIAEGFKALVTNVALL